MGLRNQKFVRVIWRTIIGLPFAVLAVVVLLIALFVETVKNKRRRRRAAERD